MAKKLGKKPAIAAPASKSSKSASAKLAAPRSTGSKSKVTAAAAKPKSAKPVKLAAKPAAVATKAIAKPVAKPANGKANGGKTNGKHAVAAKPVTNGVATNGKHAVKTIETAPARPAVTAKLPAAAPAKPAIKGVVSPTAKIALRPELVAGLAGDRGKPVLKLNKPVRIRPEPIPVRLPPAPVRSDAKMARNRAGISSRELEHFRDLLFEKRRELTGDVSSMETSALRVGSGSLSSLPMHMADAGTDNYEQEFTLGLVEKDRKLLRDINVALAKIQDGSYGICEGTGKAISKPRLEAQPWAKYSIEHARQLERVQYRRAF